MSLVFLFFPPRASTWPIVRVYSPMVFPQKTDPNGDFVRYWIPELKKIPAKYIYEPWNAPLSVQKMASLPSLSLFDFIRFVLSSFDRRIDRSHILLSRR